MAVVTKSYLLNRVAELHSSEVILSELKSYLRDVYHNTNNCYYSSTCLFVLNKIRDLEKKYKGAEK